MEQKETKWFTVRMIKKSYIYDSEDYKKTKIDS